MKKYFLFIIFFSTINLLYSQCWKTVSAGYDYTLAIAQDGTLWGWGNNSNFNLANGTKIDASIPYQISSENDWASVFASNLHHFAIKENGTLWAWGDGGGGSIGNGCTSNCFIMSIIQIGTDSNWKKVLGGHFSYTIGLKTDGTLWGWGESQLGVFGIGLTEVQNSVPIQLGTENDWIDFDTDWHTLLAIKQNGTLWGTGSNNYGQLGLGHKNYVFGLSQIGSDSNWKSVAVAFIQSLAVKTDGTLWGMGSNYYCSKDTLLSSDSLILLPKQIGTENDWKEIQAGFDWALVQKNDGTLYGWGQNVFGQLGNGTLLNQNYPTLIPNTNLIDLFSTGYNHGVIINSDKNIWSWGANSQGQIGDGTEINKKSPVQIGSPCLLNLIELTTNHDFNLLPNPADETATISLNQRASSTVNIEIHDLTGKAQAVEISTGDNTNYRLNVANLAQGLYLVKVSAMGETKTKQLIIR